MSITMGPILGLATADTDTWTVSAVVIWEGTDTPPRIEAEGAELEAAEPEILLDHHGKRAVRYRMRIARPDGEDARIAYRIADAANSFVVPQRDERPHMAFGSCNGFSHPKEMSKVDVKNALWRSPDPADSHAGVLDEHACAPFHLLLMGGDQIYADSIWSAVADLQDWHDLNTEEQANRPASDELKDDIQRFYLELYEKRWRQPEVAEAFASIPSIMMWDDHDIFDGWGSYPDVLLDSPVYQAIIKEASDHFDVFQRQTKPGNRHESGLSIAPNRTAFYNLGDGVAVLSLDLRTERRLKQVIQRKHWDEIFRFLGKVDNGRLRHLLVMSSIPVVHPDFSWADNIIGFVPKLNELEDDLRDHWNSRAHKGERTRLVHNMLRFSSEKDCRVTFLSGDVHVAAMGRIESKRDTAAPLNATSINQLTSSGIVHPGPPFMMRALLELLAQNDIELDRGIEMSIPKLPGAFTRFVVERNWLSIRPASEERLWCDLHVEHEKEPFPKVLHAIGEGRPRLSDTPVAGNGIVRAAGR